MFGIIYEIGVCETDFEEFKTKEALLDFVDDLISTTGLESYTLYVTYTREELEKYF